jgi:hypothetical protein
MATAADRVVRKSFEMRDYLLKQNPQLEKTYAFKFSALNQLTVSRLIESNRLVDALSGFLKIIQILLLHQ